MVLGMTKKQNSKRPPKILARNHAVQAVGETYFRVALLGMAAASVLAIVAVSIGSTRGMFEFRIDRCDCLLTSEAQNAVDEGQDCVFGQDMLGVNIGWKSFVIDHAVSTEGCLDGWEGTTDIGTPFGDGIYKKKTEVYGNGATGAADACVGLFVVSAAIAVIMYKTVKMSYAGPGSIYSIGLHNIAMLCLLLSIASAISVMAFWGRVQGKLGNLSSSLAVTLFRATLDVCQDDWDTVGFPIDDEEFCEAAPWTFDVPLYASWTAIAHVGIMFLASVWILGRSALVEGILDGSKLASGKTVTPRVVEFEQAVGRALATTEDPDYDVPGNKLYTGEQNIMIRPYPLPGSVKKKVAKAAEALVSPLRNMSPTRSHARGKSKAAGLSRTSNVVDNNEGFTPKIIGSDLNGEEGYMLNSGSTGSAAGYNESQGPPSPGPVRPIPKPLLSKAAAKAARKAAKKAAKKGPQPGGKHASSEESEIRGTDGSKPTTGGGHARQSSRTTMMPKMPSLGGFGRKTKETENVESPGAGEGGDGEDGGDVDSDEEGSSSSVIVLPVEGDGMGAGAAPGTRHGKTRSEIDWNSIMEAGGSGDGNTGVEKSHQEGKGDGSPHLSPSMLGDLDMMFNGPSVKDGLTLGAITEDPREDMISEFTITPRKKGSATQFEV